MASLRKGLGLWALDGCLFFDNYLVIPSLDVYLPCRGEEGPLGNER